MKIAIRTELNFLPVSYVYESLSLWCNTVSLGQERVHRTFTTQRKAAAENCIMSRFIIYRNILRHIEYLSCRPGWLQGLRRGSEAAGSLGLWLQILPGARKSVSCGQCCMFSVRGLCERLISHPEESYQVWCMGVIVKRWEWGGPGPTGRAAPWGGRKVFIIHSVYSYSFFSTRAAVDWHVVC